MRPKAMDPLIYRSNLFYDLGHQLQDWILKNKISHAELSQDLRLELDLYVTAFRSAREHRDVERYILELEIYLNDSEQAYDDDRIEMHEFESRIYKWLDFLDVGYGYLKEENEGESKFVQFIKKYEKKYRKQFEEFGL